MELPLFKFKPLSLTLPNSRILELLSNRLPESLVGAITSVEASRALSRQIRRR